jgi:hypothetical protein
MNGSLIRGLSDGRRRAAVIEGVNPAHRFVTAGGRSEAWVSARIPRRSIDLTNSADGAHVQFGRGSIRL